MNDNVVTLRVKVGRYEYELEVAGNTDVRGLKNEIEKTAKIEMKKCHLFLDDTELKEEELPLSDIGIANEGTLLVEADKQIIARCLLKDRAVSRTVESLFERIKQCDLDTTQLLLEAGVPINAQDNGASCTPLMEACVARCLPIVVYLLQAGADHTLCDTWRTTPLMYAARAGQHEVTKALLEYDNNIDAVDASGRTALMVASMGGFVDVAKLLIEKGANVRVKSDYGTALSLAAKKGNNEIVEALLSVGADMKNTSSPLLVACENGHTHTARLLLFHSAPIDTQDKHGWSPLMNATWNNHISTVEFLLSKDASVHLQTKNNETALALANKKGFTDLAAILSRMEV